MSEAGSPTISIHLSTASAVRRVSFLFSRLGTKAMLRSTVR